MDNADTILIRAWELWLADPTDEKDEEIEKLIAPLVDAGYAEVEGYTWGFTPEGIKRAEELVPED